MEGNVYREDAVVPELDRSTLVVGISGRLFGIDRATGDVRWQYAIPGWVKGEVFLAVRYGLVIASAFSGRIVALDYQSGAERWIAETTASGRASIVVESDLIVCAKGGYVDAFDHAGAKRWSQPLRGAGQGRIALGFPGNVAQADDAGSQ